MSTDAPFTRQVMIRRLLFWAFLTATLEVPTLGIIYGMFGHELTPAAIVIGLCSFAGTCFSCGLLVDHQPQLVRRGMLCLAFNFVLLFFSGLVLGPITN
jgi:hypothetical protein